MKRRNISEESNDHCGRHCTCTALSAFPLNLELMRGLGESVRHRDRRRIRAVIGDSRRQIQFPVFAAGGWGVHLTPDCPHLRISVCCRFEELCFTPSKARRVGTTCRDVRTGSLHHWLTPAVVLLFGLGWTGGASASSVSSAGFDAAEHAQHCNCGAKCRQASCCCGPRNPKVRPPLSPPVPGATEADSTPCLKSSPCQGSGLPTAPNSPGPSGKVTASAIGAHAPFAAAGRFLPSPPRCILPARRVSRRDKPPEHLALA